MLNNDIRFIAAEAMNATPDTWADDANTIVEQATQYTRHALPLGRDHTALLMARGVALYALAQSRTPEDGAAALRAMGWALDSLPNPWNAAEHRPQV